MNVSKPIDAEIIGDRQYACSFDVEDRGQKRRVYAHISWEAITGEQPRHVTEEEMNAGLQRLKRDEKRRIANAVRDQLFAKNVDGSEDFPIHISSSDVPR